MDVGNVQHRIVEVVKVIPQDQVIDGPENRDQTWSHRIRHVSYVDVVVLG